MKNVTGSPSSRSSPSRLTENRTAVTVPHRSIHGDMVAGRGEAFPGFMCTAGKSRPGRRLQSSRCFDWSRGTEEAFTRWGQSEGHSGLFLCSSCQPRGTRQQRPWRAGAAGNSVTPPRRTGTRGSQRALNCGPQRALYLRGQRPRGGSLKLGTDTIGCIFTRAGKCQGDGEKVTQ